MAYVGEDSDDLKVIDVSDPANPLIVGSIDVGSFYDIVIAGNMLYVANGSSGLQVIDVSNPAAPLVIDSIDILGGAYGVTVSGDMAYVATGNYGLQIVLVPVELGPVTIYNSELITVTMPAASMAGKYNLKVFDDSEEDNLTEAMTLAFTIPLTQTEISQLYIAIFGRASEGDGNSYWQTDPASTSLSVTANLMLNTEAAATYFGTNLDSNHDFIEHIYLNTLGKTYAEDTNGIDYWVDELANGKTKGEVIATLITAAQDPVNAGAAQDQFNNKVAVSNYCADTILVYTTLDTFTGFISSVNDDPATVTFAMELIDIEAQ